ncbi:heterokaryon incompatibility protein, partial [Polyplosphaeria fusca]
MAKRYEYQPLCQSTSDIRLLRLLPSNGNHTLKNIPSCEIFHTSLQAAPGFEALSYAWGDASDKRIILLGNCSVRVTSNLFNAIMALRPLKEPSIIWIDSLCINQSDTNEKSWQVGLMSDIYQQAQKVIAWLGPADGSSDAVIDYLITLGERAHACGLSMGCKRSMEIWQTITSDPLAFQKLPESLDVSPMPFLRKMVSKYAIRDLLYSIDGWHEQDALLPMGGIKRLFGRSW